MYFEANTIDDLLKNSIEEVLKEPRTIVSSRKGENFETTGVYLRLINPLARLSTSLMKGMIFSPLGETLWYLSGSNNLDFVQYYIKVYDKYSDDNQTLFGAYGPRILGTEGFELNQLNNIIALLTKKQDTRQAVIQILRPRDLFVKTKDLPCTISLQFLVRDAKLNMFVSMRSNDMFKGFIHDVFFFTMLQEIIARTLKIDVGHYNHFVSSFHLYQEDLIKAEKYLKEGFHSTKYFMPRMPEDNIWENIETVLKVEKKIRRNQMINIEEVEICDYWKDILYLLQAYSISQSKPESIHADLNMIHEKIHHNFYRKYILEKLIKVYD